MVLKSTKPILNACELGGRGDVVCQGLSFGQILKEKENGTVLMYRPCLPNFRLLKKIELLKLLKKKKKKVDFFFLQDNVVLLFYFFFLTSFFEMAKQLNLKQKRERKISQKFIPVHKKIHSRLLKSGKTNEHQA